MKATLLTLALFVAAASNGKLQVSYSALAQQTPMPPAGNPNHEEPAPGSFCAHGPTVPEGQRCECEPKCMDGHDGEGNPNGEVWRTEDNAKCRAACHPKSCACTSNCEP